MFIKYSTLMQKNLHFFVKVAGFEKYENKNHINTDKHKQDNRKKDSPKGFFLKFDVFQFLIT